MIELSPYIAGPNKRLNEQHQSRPPTLVTGSIGDLQSHAH